MLAENRQLNDLLPVVACSLLGLVICGVKSLGGPTSSYELFYVFPVLCAAWWGQFPLGTLVTLEIVFLGLHHRGQPWHDAGAGTDGLDAILRFCFYILVCSLVCRLRSTVLLERTRARTDSLTGAANGRVFYEALNAEIQRFASRHEPFTLAYLDIDDFKKANDQFGHATGDKILKTIVETVLVHTRRNGDTIARLGGDEFALILSDTTADTAPAILNKLREVLAQEMADNAWPVTFSIGAMNFCRIPGDVEVLIQKVDSLMYKAKRNGKNDLCFEVLQQANEHKDGSERRASIRVTCNRTIRINTLENGKQDSCLARTLDISATGILFHSAREFPKGTVILVAPVGPLPGVLAKVVRTIKETDGWLHGCKMAQVLNMNELQKWLEPREDISTRRQAACRW
jgi:diguanylate cyclase (GGDEF)-like protein